MRVCLEAKHLGSLKWRRHDHAGGGAAVGQQFLDEIFEFGHGGEDDFEHEGVVAGEVMAFLDGDEGGEELEEGFVAGALASEADEGGDGEAEGVEIDVGAIAANDLEAFEAAKALCGGGGGEANAAA